MREHSIIFKRDMREGDKNSLFTEIMDAVAGICDGYIHITIRDSKIIRIEKGEELRLSERIYEIMELRL